MWTVLVYYSWQSVVISYMRLVTAAMETQKPKRKGRDQLNLQLIFSS
jgi:hypothetical protein